MIKSKITSISLTGNIYERINKFVTQKAKPTPTITIHLTKYHYDFYQSIDKGDRSSVFSHIISDFLTVLEKEEQINSPIFFYKNELIRMSLIYNELNNNINKRELVKEVNGKGIVGRIPVGNKYHPDGEWQNNHGKYDMLRFEFLEKIYEKLNASFSRTDIIVNFDLFYKAYKDGLFDENTVEYQIKKMKEMLKE